MDIYTADLIYPKAAGICSQVTSLSQEEKRKVYLVSLVFDSVLDSCALQLTLCARPPLGPAPRYLLY